MGDYRDFIARKHIRTMQSGFEPDEGAIPAGLFDWQAEAVRWACRTVRAALSTAPWARASNAGM